jgi:PBP1b-binding outer membrane lipoprotein LpoB
MKKLAILLISLILLAACGNSPANTSNANANKPPTDPATLVDRANPLSNPMSSVAYQFELVKAGDYDKLVDCFTDKAKKKLTREIVQSAKVNSEKINFDDIAASVEEEENSNGKFAQIRMKDHRTLVILALHDGKWLSDGVWFR